MSLRRSLRSLIRAGRSGRKRKGGVAKTVAKTAAKWAVKQGVKRGVQTLAAAIASNPIGWAIGGAVVVAAGGMFAAAVFVALSVPSGELAEGGLAPGPNQALGAVAAPVGTGAVGTLGAGLDPNSPEGYRICGQGCSTVLTAGSDLLVLNHWLKGLPGTKILDGVELSCPLDPDVIEKGTGAGDTREAWGNPRGGGVRFHAGLDIYKLPPDTVENKAVVRAVYAGKILHSPSGDDFSFYLVSDINGQWVEFLYDHIDKGTLPQEHSRWERGERLHSRRSPDGTETQGGSDQYTTISDATSGGIGSNPHIHLGIETEGRNLGPGEQGVGDWNPYPAFKGPCELESGRI